MRWAGKSLEGLLEMDLCRFGENHHLENPLSDIFWKRSSGNGVQISNNLIKE